MITSCAGNLFQTKRNVGLCPQVELHVGIDWKGVVTLFADASPVAVCSHEPFVDSKAGLFADGALDCVQATFDFLLSDGNHVDASIAVWEMKSQPALQGRRDRLTTIRVALY